MLNSGHKRLHLPFEQRNDESRVQFFGSAGDYKPVVNKIGKGALLVHLNNKYPNRTVAISTVGRN